MNSNSFMNYRQKNEDQTFSPYHHPAYLTFNQTTIILSGEEFYNIHGMQRFISPFFKKTDRPPCHITLCCLSHTSLKMHITLWVTLDSTFIRITSARPCRNAQTCPDVSRYPRAANLRCMNSRQALWGAFKILRQTYVHESVWTVKYEQTEEIDWGTLAR